MLKGKVLTMIGFMMYNGVLYSQDSLSSPDVKLMPYRSAWGVHIEYSYLETNSPGIGANFLLERTHQKIFGRQVAYSFDCTLTGLFYNDIFSLGQRIDLGINCEKFSPDLHIFFEHNDKSDFRVGGKAGLSFGNFVYLHYRYGLPVGNYENTYISRHGITITIKLNWIAISHLYDV